MKVGDIIRFSTLKEMGITREESKVDYIQSSLEERLEFLKGKLIKKDPILNVWKIEE